MPEVLLTTHEIEEGDFPNYCFLCGKHGAELVPRRLEEVRFRFRTRVTRWREAELPFCRRHVSGRLPRWGLWGRHGNATFDAKGVWVKGADPDFIDALWDHREKKYHRRDRESRRGREEMARHPSSRPQRGDPTWERPAPNTGGCVLAVVLVSVFVLLAGLAFAVFLIVPALSGGPGRPGFGPGPQPGPVGPLGPPPHHR
jgi:hypothetical protein